MSISKIIKLFENTAQSLRSIQIWKVTRKNELFGNLGRLEYSLEFIKLSLSLNNQQRLGSVLIENMPTRFISIKLGNSIAVANVMSKYALNER